MAASLRIAWLGLALASGAWACLVAMTGGVVIDLAGLHVSSRDAARPALLAMLLTTLSVWRRGRAGTMADLTRLSQVAPRPWVLAPVAALLTVLAGATLGTRGVGGSDSYGYASQADLWLAGTLRVEQDFVGDLPWPDAAQSMTPLGFRPTGDAGTYAPIAAPGLALTMVPFLAAGGREAILLVVPLLAGLGVWLTYRLGVVVFGEAAGLMAAVLLALSPAFVFQLLSAPMSDIPAATWWTLAMLLAATHRERRTHLTGSGLAVSLAVVTRPNLALLAAPVAATLLWPRASRAAVGRRLGLWGAPALAGPLVVAAVNQALNGSPVVSGYGDLDASFDVAHVWPNAIRYGRWLLDTQTPFVLLALLAPFAVRRAGAPRASVWLAWSGLAVTALVTASYLAYTVFDAWWTLRFLLPAYPFALTLASATAVAASRRLGPAGMPVLVLVTALVAGRGLAVARAESLLSLQRVEGRYRTAATLAAALPRPAVVISLHHSGSVRYYGHALTLRYDRLDPAWLDRAIAHLAGKGQHVYAVLDPFEVEQVRTRFAGRADLSWLDRPPRETTPEGVLILDVRPPD